MNTKLTQHIFLGLGFIFTSIIGLQFSNGLSYEGMWFFNIPVRLHNVAGIAPSFILKSNFLGYLFYALFGYSILKTLIKEHQSKSSAVIFLTLVSYALFIEGSFIYRCIESTYSGRYFYIGTVTFAYGLIVYFKTYGKTHQVV